MGRFRGKEGMDFGGEAVDLDLMVSYDRGEGTS